MTDDPRFTRVSEICLGLPETKWERLTFWVGSKPFAYWLDDHHGDGITAVSFRMPPGENEAVATAEADRYYLPAYMGPRGWLALRLDTGAIDWEEVEGRLVGSYLLAAPKRLASRIT